MFLSFCSKYKLLYQQCKAVKGLRSLEGRKSVNRDRTEIPLELKWTRK